MNDEDPQPLCVIVEGMDRTGKSTLIEALKAEYPGPWVTIHNSRQPDKRRETAFKQYHGQVLHAKLCPSHWYVWDRLHISERVYSALYRGGNDRFMDAIDAFLPEQRTVIILCERDLQGLFKDDDGDSTWEEYASMDPYAAAKEQQAFRDAVYESGHEVIIVDPVNCPEQTLAAIGEAITLLGEEVHA